MRSETCRPAPNRVSASPSPSITAAAIADRSVSACRCSLRIRSAGGPVSPPVQALGSRSRRVTSAPPPAFTWPWYRPAPIGQPLLAGLLSGPERRVQKMANPRHLLAWRF